MPVMLAKDPKIAQNFEGAKSLLKAIKVQNLVKQGGEIGYIGLRADVRDLGFVGSSTSSRFMVLGFTKVFRGAPVQCQVL